MKIILGKMTAYMLTGLVLAVFSYPTLAAKPTNSPASEKKVSICHYQKDTGSYQKISVSVNALEAHLAHGDGTPGAGNFTSECSLLAYNNIPNPIPGNIPSMAFEANSTSEFGGQISLSGSVPINPKVTVLMSSWGCESGSWTNGNCLTTPGATFPVDITLNVYNVGTGNAVGTKITSVTQSFNIPYRPSTSTVCGDGRWSKDGTAATCFNGLATPITFNLSGITMPNNLILGVAYNTTHYGYHPVGASASCYGTSGGCGYDSLNVGVLSSLPSTSYPLPDGAYLNSTWAGAYGDNGAVGIGSFRLDPVSWTGYQPAFSVS